MHALHQLGRAGTATQRLLRDAARGALTVLRVLGQVAFTVWAAAYLAVNRLTGGELDWALTTRHRWTSFARRAARTAPPAAVYHGHDFSALGAAIAAASLHGGRVVYDSHELYVEAGTIGRRSSILKWMLRRVERRMYEHVDRLISVNRPVAEELQRRYGAKPTTLVHNCPPRWTPPRKRPDLFRSVLPIPADAPIALYQGGFSAVRGLREMAEAILAPGLNRVHLIYLGFGAMEQELRRLAAEPRFGGRIWVLEAVDPAELDAWIASADVSLMPNQPQTLNEIVSTPNKLFESIGAGVPVVTSDFPERRRIVLDDPLGPLGAVCDPTDPRSIAAAIGSVVIRSAEDAEALRRRCLAAAHERWNWETEEQHLVRLYEELSGAASAIRSSVRAAH